MMAGQWDLVTHPDTFFAWVSQEVIDLRPPLAIFVTGALLPILVYLAVVAYASIFISPAFSTAIPAMMRIFLICNIGLPLAGWVLMSLWTYGISRGLGGKGSLAATIRDTGYGLMPWALSIVLFMLYSGIVYAIAFAVPAVSGTVEEFAPVGYEAWPYLGLLVMIWEWYLWTLAARHTHGFPLRTSAAITAIPVLLFLVVMISAMGLFDAVRMIMAGS